MNIFQVKYTEAILSNSTRKLLRFEITKIYVPFIIIVFYLKRLILCRVGRKTTTQSIKLKSLRGSGTVHTEIQSSPCVLRVRVCIKR